MAISSIGYAGQIGWPEWSIMAAHLGANYTVLDPTLPGLAGIAGKASLWELTLAVTSADSRVVTISTGAAHGRGVTVILDAPEKLTLAAAEGWWTIAIRRDWSAGAGAEVSSLVALNGGTTKAVAAGREKTPGKIDDQPLWLVHVNAAGRVDETADVRCWWGDGGMRAASTLALAYLTEAGSVVWVGDTVWRLNPQRAWVAGGDRAAAGGTTLLASSAGINVTPAKLHGAAPTVAAGTAATASRLVVSQPDGTLKALSSRLPAGLLPTTVPTVDSSGSLHLGSASSTAVSHLGMVRKLTNGQITESQFYVGDDGLVLLSMAGTDTASTRLSALMLGWDGLIKIWGGGVWRHQPFAMWNHSGHWGIPARQAALAKRVAFPAGMFTKAPVVVATVADRLGGSYGGRVIARVSDTTTAGTSITVHRDPVEDPLIDPQTVRVGVIAMQASPDSATV